jgi:polyphosphate kinase
METCFFDRDISWLAFNHRVLMEAADTNVPLLERLKFLSIYSTNLDEFYRVRIPVLLSLKKIEDKTNDTIIANIVSKIGAIVTSQMKELGAILVLQIIPQLKNKQVHLVYNEPIPHFLADDCTAYFVDKVAGFLQPILLNEKLTDLVIENNKLQILVLLADETGREYLAMVNIPCNILSRFYFKNDTQSGTRFIVFLDDIIKANLYKVFAGFTIKASYSFKITRDAALDLADEYEGDIAAKIKQQIKKRDFGLATRFLYQPGISERLLHAVVDKLHLTNANIVAGGNYHNLKDLAKLPIDDKQHFIYENQEPINTKAFATTEPIFNLIAKKDLLVHTPYESYYPIIRFFNEASVDKNVTEIYVAIYRVAHNSMIGNSLISAAKNGKKVTVFIELKARFDEENNLNWALKMKEAGVKIIYSIPGLKVHAKVALVKRIENDRQKYYGLFSTGNFNENTAHVYTDHVLLTADPVLLRELELLFIFFTYRVKPKKHQTLNFEHLLVGQFNLQSKFIELIDNEIAYAKQGIAASIIIKINSLEEKIMINKLYEASTAGVQIKLIVRGICCLIPGIVNKSENITVTRIVDRYLEHGRIFTFSNNNAPLVYIGSSDWMNRSMYRRIEVCVPIYDQELKEQIMQLLSIQLADTVKSTILNDQLQNIRKEKTDLLPAVQSQKAIYDLLNC